MGWTVSVDEDSGLRLGPVDQVGAGFEGDIGVGATGEEKGFTWRKRLHNDF